MAEIFMPKMGEALTEGKVIRWYKKPGDAVKKGEPVLEIETDKVNLDLEAESDGKLGELAAQEGQMVPVGGVLAQILGEGETAAPAPPSAKSAAEGSDDTSELQRRATDKKDSVKKTTGEYAEAIATKGPRRDRSQPDVAPPPPAAQAPNAAEGDATRRRSSPLARRMARDLGVPLESLQGSGPQGRI